jgi:chromosome segregation ATPase
MAKRNTGRVFMAAAGVLIIALSASSLFLVKVNLDSKSTIATLARKCEAIQKKYADQKRQAEEYLRVKASVEGQQRSTLAESEKALKEKESVQVELRELRKTHEDLLGKCATLTTERDKLKRDMEDLRKSQSQAEQDNRKEVARMETARKELEKKLGHTTEDLERCVTANAELSAISKELLAKYRNKGVVSALAAQEPLTQINKVKLEEYVQEYSEKVEALKIEKKN